MKRDWRSAGSGRIFANGVIVTEKFIESNSLQPRLESVSIGQTLTLGPPSSATASGDAIDSRLETLERHQELSVGWDDRPVAAAKNA